VRPSLRSLLKQPDAMLLGTFVLIPRVEIVEALGHAGFAFVILDLEHGPFGVSELPALIAAANGVGMHAVVRVPTATEAVIGSVLDAGADGVLVPHVSSPDTAADVVAASRFAPQGARSVNPYVRAARYYATDDFLQEANDDIAVVVMVEGKDGLDALRDIAVVPGLDAIFVGPVDLSAALGVPGQPEHPKVQDSVRGILTDLAAAGVPAGIYAPTPQAASRWRGLGTRLVALSADMAMAYGGFISFAQGVDGKPAPASPA
jgi:2-keto-3-deoxy-L-rhamnonate aldolase RhmA